MLYGLVVNVSDLDVKTVRGQEVLVVDPVGRSTPSIQAT